MSEEVKRKFFLVTASFLCRTLGMELRRTVQFPAHMTVDAKLTMQNILNLRDDGVRKLSDIYGINAEGGWTIIAEAVTPLLVGIMTLEEFSGPPTQPLEEQPFLQSNPVLEQAIRDGLSHHQV